MKLCSPFPVVEHGEKPHEQHFRFGEPAAILTRVLEMPYGHGYFNRHQQKRKANRDVNQNEGKLFPQQQADTKRKSNQTYQKDSG